MDWWKLFGGTFILIFLAELGDKTQLAALAKTADSPDSPAAKWVVFLAASSALVFSTFIAVFLGHILKSIIPDERYIKAASAILFLVFGVMILYETFGKPAALPAPAAATVTEEPGYAGRLALAGALEFEAITAARYRHLAEDATDAGLKKLLLSLASDEDRHLASIRKMQPGSATPSEGASTSARLAVETAVAPLPADADACDREILDELIRRETATADFYLSLAGRTLIPSVKQTFLRLAEEEISHARRLTAMVPGQPPM